MLQHEANINACDSKGQPPLYHGILRGRLAIVKLLLIYCFTFPLWVKHKNTTNLKPKTNMINQKLKLMHTIVETLNKKNNRTNK